MKILAFIALVFLAVSCGNNSDVDTNEDATKQDLKLVADNDFDRLMGEIDLNLPSFTHVQSLTYHKEDGSMITASAYLDQNNVITKIDEEYINVVTKERARYSYYSNGGVLFATRSLSEKVKDSTAYFSDQISFYSPDGKVKSSKERISDFEDYIENESYHEISSVAHSQDRALRVLRQLDEFMPTFQGFVENGPYHFLIVGENVSENGYTSSLSIQEEDATIRYLRKAGIDAIGDELKVEFEKITDTQGYTIQILKSVALVERR